MRYLGNKGEDYAVKILKKQKYKILERNFTIRGGEIDIVAKDGETLVFVEVKMRKNKDHGAPEEFVDARKRQKLIYTAKCYISSRGISDTDCRFDVVSIIAKESPEGKLIPEDVNIIKNAFIC